MCNSHVTIIAWRAGTRAATAVRIRLSKIYAVDESHDWVIVCPSHSTYGKVIRKIFVLCDPQCCDVSTFDQS